MGGQFRFVSSYRSDFNNDFNVSFPPEDAFDLGGAEKTIWRSA